MVCRLLVPRYCSLGSDDLYHSAGEATEMIDRLRSVACDWSVFIRPTVDLKG